MRIVRNAKYVIKNGKLVAKDGKPLFDTSKRYLPLWRSTTASFKRSVFSSTTSPFLLSTSTISQPVTTPPGRTVIALARVPFSVKTKSSAFISFKCTVLQRDSRALIERAHAMGVNREYQAFMSLAFLSLLILSKIFT